VLKTIGIVVVSALAVSAPKEEPGVAITSTLRIAEHRRHVRFVPKADIGAATGSREIDIACAKSGGSRLKASE
jgi:hypothetical protein